MVNHAMELCLVDYDVATKVVELCAGGGYCTPTGKTSSIYLCMTVSPLLLDRICYSIDGWMVSFILTPRFWRYAGYHYDVKRLGYAITPGVCLSPGRRDYR